MQTLLLPTTSLKSIVGTLQFAKALAKNAGCPLTVLQVVNEPSLSKVPASDLEIEGLTNASFENLGSETKAINDLHFICKKDVDFWSTIEHTAHSIAQGLTLFAWNDVKADALIKIPALIKKTMQPVLLVPENMQAFRNICHIGLLENNLQPSHIREDDYQQQLVGVFGDENKKDILVTFLNKKEVYHVIPMLLTEEVLTPLTEINSVLASLLKVRTGQEPGYKNNIDILAVPVDHIWLNELLPIILEQYHIPVLLLSTMQTPVTEKRVCPKTDACKMCPNCRKQAGAKAIKMSKV